MEKKLKESKPGSRETRYKASCSKSRTEMTYPKEVETKIQGGLENIKEVELAEPIVIDWWEIIKCYGGLP